MPNDIPTDTGFNRLEQPLQSERRMRIICLGAGASGLLFAYKLQRSFSNFDLTLFEKNPDIAGTWYENKYPGCACDVPAHTYTWSFEPKADWSSVYAKAQEIRAHFNHFADKHNLRPYVKLNHEIVRAKWGEIQGTWEVEVLDRTTQSRSLHVCDILINAGGVLNSWKWPEIPGLKEFKGTLLHTAAWDTETDLKEKRVGLIGNGSSGIQILPSIQPEAKTVKTFIRRPTWIMPIQGLEQRLYTDEEKAIFENKPGALLELRKKQETTLNGLFPMMIRDSEVQRKTLAHMSGQMRERLPSELHEKLIPTYSIGCRRITPGVGYLESLNAKNVEIVYGNIDRITETGIVGEDGRSHELDILICATGFNTSYRPRFPVIGKYGKNLADEWAQEPKSYFGLAAAHFPNYFMIAGPNSPVTNGPLLSAIEAQMDYILKFVNRWQTENIHSFAPTEEAIQDLIDFKDEFMKKTVWVDDCNGWYHQNGKVTAIWPGSTLHYLETLSAVRYDDWHFKYTGNRFTYLGNGTSQTENDPTADWAYYITEQDDSPYLGNKRARQVMNKSGSTKNVAFDGGDIPF
ncbi:FAD/NAD(P)-binding domain-containing protein [Pluteus cervinus]|uniref:FAD/NAD(P)-binding domain-containing protein n=1 Tax=Pluteus cervinus TaxID=181527 RepID=A0ACD3B0A4_9AGAR|nr:FAD/NAD(P)-binding domain-containing protein [Pluteus cervinus]